MMTTIVVSDIKELQVKYKIRTLPTERYFHGTV